MVGQREHVEVLRLLGSVDSRLLPPGYGPRADVRVAFDQLVKEKRRTWTGYTWKPLGRGARPIVRALPVCMSGEASCMGPRDDIRLYHHHMVDIFIRGELTALLCSYDESHSLWFSL